MTRTSTSASPAQRQLCPLSTPRSGSLLFDFSALSQGRYVVFTALGLLTPGVLSSLLHRALLNFGLPMIPDFSYHRLLSQTKADTKIRIIQRYHDHDSLACGYLGNENTRKESRS